MRTVDPQAGPKNLYRMLPSVDEVLRDESVEPLLRLHERDAVLLSAQRTLDEIREEIFNEVHSEEALSNRVKALPQAIAVRLNKPHDFSLRRVINATGVILHTNLGRAPLSKLALDRIVETASGYSNLEFDSETGERGRRDVHVESLLLSVLGDAANIPDLGDTHRAIVVNNCAAATFLVLHALAKDKDVLVSRGELVEIGGGFRIPEILAASGANLREVGTTNRTRIADYESAITTNAGLILRVHQSNFSMEGFIETSTIEQLVALGTRAQVPVFFDQGTGLVDSLTSGGVAMGELTVGDCIVRGCDLVAASGDKLLGGPQCGILVGRKNLVEHIRKNPLFRTLRVDKLVYAALEATLVAYSAKQKDQIPILRMLQTTPDQIKERCHRVAEGIHGDGLSTAVVATESVIGGGTAPKAKLQSYAVSLSHGTLDAAALLRALRRLDPPIVGRIQDDQVLLDLRTVEPEFDAHLIEVLSRPLYSSEGLPS
jgi:L-seryl-tRNA(Ser) seleniumtransferase